MTILYNLLLMSISGSIMYALSAIVHRQLRQRSARWYYALLVTASAMFLIPIQSLFTAHKLFKVTVPSAAVVSGGHSINTVISAGTGISFAGILLSLWAAISLILLSVTAYQYFKAARNLRKISVECSDDNVLEAYLDVCCDMRINRNIEIRQSEDIHSPLLFGVLRPFVIVPQRSFTYKELVMIFTHELTHYRHCDLAVKLFMSLVRCIHFFNPAVYLLSRSINEGCELCCDETVLDRLNLPDKKDYGRLIISVIESRDRTVAYSTAMASPKDKIQKRLLRIIRFRKPSVLLRTISVMLAAALLICSLTAFGFEAAKEALGEEITDAVTHTLTGSGSSPFADIPITAPAETEAAPTAAPEEPEDTESTEQAAAEPAEENAEADAPAQGIPVPQEPAVIYSFDVDQEETSAEAVPSSVPAEALRTIELPGASYVFNPVFANGITEVRSDNISVVNDMFAAIYRYSGNNNCYVRIYKIKDNEADELIYDETQLETNGSNLYIRFSKGETYYIIAQQNNSAERDSLYISAR